MDEIKAHFRQVSLRLRCNPKLLPFTNIKHKHKAMISFLTSVFVNRFTPTFLAERLRIVKGE